MSSSQDRSPDLMIRAQEARKAGDTGQAISLLRELVGSEPNSAAAWNMLGLLQLEQNQFADAAESLTRAVAADPAPPLWLNLSRAQRALGDHAAELQSLDGALSKDAYYLPALLAKGEALRTLGRSPEAVELYRLLLDGLPASATLPPAIAARVEEARSFVRSEGDKQFERYATALEDVAKTHPGADLARARGYAEHRAAKRKVYVNQPTGPHFPYLPAIEYFNRSHFPWFEELERHTDVLREELLSVLAEDARNFRPYVAYPAGTPANQWSELNHSPRWSAFFFWENGKRNEANCGRCPRTAALLERLPLLDVPDKAPTSMFSVLTPRTRIPPHTGTSNIRTTVHLPLVVPPGCGFRVGSETREWQEGAAWAFDDTIEHEAWNDSDQMRAILIVDAWNPLLSEAERDLVRRIG